METEAKFIVPSEATFESLHDAEVFGPYERRDAVTKQAHDRYLDTADHSFYKHNFAVRLRAYKDGGLLLTLKRVGGQVAGAIHSRDEYEVHVGALDVSTWPEGEVRDMVQQIGGGKPLEELFSIEQTRFVSHLYQGERDVAEMSLDRVAIGAPGGPVSGYELEVELLPEGLMSDLRILARLLMEEYNLAPQPLSKFEQAAVLTSAFSHDEPTPQATAQASEDEEATPKKAGAGAHAAGVLPTDSAGTAARKIIGERFREMLANEKGTRKGKDPEALHDMRVATRRMRAVLRVYADYITGPDVKAVRKGLRDLAHAQGAVRDLDVLIGHAQKFREGLPTDERPSLGTLIDSWRSQRDQARKELIRLLDSKDYARFVKQMHHFLEEDADNVPPHDGGDVEPYQVRHLAGSAIWDRYEAARAFETVMDAPKLEQLHQLRIAGKYLRYTLECFSDVLPPDTHRLIKEVTEMQDQLGDLHDADVAAGLIRSFVSAEAKKAKRAKKSRLAQGGGLTSYLEEREAAMHRLQADFGPTWRHLSSPQWRARLASAVADL